MTSANSSESVFVMDPEPVIQSTARMLVSQLRALAESQRARDSMEALTAPEPVAAALAERRRQFEAAHDNLLGRWSEEAFPHAAAALAVAVDFLDTFGPGRRAIEDQTEAALWNNKYFVYVNEFRLATSNTKRDQGT
jgi:hypothetical protein